MTHIFLLSAPVFPSEQTTEKPDYKTLLFQAAKNGNLEVLQQCIGLVDLNVYDEEGFTPIHHAFFKDHWDIVFCLLKNGADINLQRKQMNPDDLGGWTLLHQVATRGDVLLLQMLISWGADITLPIEDSIITPYLAAYLRGNKEICDILKLYGAYTIFDAIECDDIKTVKELLPLHIHDVGIRRRNLLHLAVHSASKEMIKLLLASNVNVNALDMHGETPLSLVVRYGRLDIVRLLLDNGANVNSTCCLIGNTPLHVAVQAQNPEMIKLLLLAGARTNTRNRNDKTPYDLTADMEKSHRNEIVAILNSSNLDHNDHQSTILPWSIGTVTAGLLIYLVWHNYAHHA